MSDVEDRRKKFSDSTNDVRREYILQHRNNYLWSRLLCMHRCKRFMPSLNKILFVFAWLLVESCRDSDDDEKWCYNFERFSTKIVTNTDNEQHTFRATMTFATEVSLLSKSSIGRKLLIFIPNKYDFSKNTFILLWKYNAFMSIIEKSISFD